MQSKNILITINNLDDLKVYEKLGNVSYVYPLKDFCVGMPNTFLISEIVTPAYLFINRILDNAAIDALKEILKKLPANIKGIIFDDLGVLELLQELDLKLERILYLSHFNTNLESIKIYLEYVDSVIVPFDITKEEAAYIINNLKDKLTVLVLGYLPAMYSRRLLLDNYSKFYNLAKTNPLVITNNKQQFLVSENAYGTVFYHLPLYKALDLFDFPCRYYFINTAFLSSQEVISLLEGKSSIPTARGFLEIPTIYKLRGENDA